VNLLVRPSAAILTDLLHVLLYKIKLLVIQEKIPLMEGREVSCPVVALSKLTDITITSAFPESSKTPRSRFECLHPYQMKRNATCNAKQNEFSPPGQHDKPCRIANH
jgi:hypothetical protein